MSHFQNSADSKSIKNVIHRSTSLDDDKRRNVVERSSTFDDNDDSDISERIVDSLEDQGVQDSGVGSSSEKTSTVKVRLGWAGLGLAGLGWAWLGLAGLGWAWLGLAGLGWAGLLLSVLASSLEKFFLLFLSVKGIVMEQACFKKYKQLCQYQHLETFGS
jgi:hypothetical protein